MKSIEPVAACRRCRRPFDDHYFPTPRKLHEKIMRNVHRQGAIIRANETHSLPSGRTSDKAAQRNARCVESANGIVHRPTAAHRPRIVLGCELAVPPVLRGAAAMPTLDVTREETSDCCRSSTPLHP